MIKEELIRIVDNAFNAGEIESQITEQESIDTRKEILINQKLRELVEEKINKLVELLSDCNLNILKTQEEIQFIIKTKNDYKSLLDEAKK